MSQTKIAVITGANKGLGLSLVHEFEQAGWQVIGTGRSPRVTDMPKAVAYAQFDASDAVASASFWADLKQKYPDPQEVCLVNNAGGYIGGSLVETKPEGYAQQMQSCYFTSVYMTRGLALQYLRARIINIISSSALAAHKNNSAYGAAKAAEMHFFQSLQHEFKPEKYQITNLYPSDIASYSYREDAMSAKELSGFVREIAQNTKSYYLRDVTMYPRAAE